MIIELKGRNALVCGSTQGLGRAVAFQLAQAGANITLMARNGNTLAETAQSLPNNGLQKHDYITADFEFPGDIDIIIGLAINKGMVYDILVNNTGGPPPGEANSASPNDYLKAFNMHLVSSQTLLKNILPGMKQSGSGRIINIISVGARQPIDGLGVSNTIRGAMANWAKTLSRELAVFGITVNNILPGNIRTGRLDALIKNRASQSVKSIDEVEVDMISKIPVGRFGKPDELAFLVVFLCSNYADYINGTSIPVDGGLLTCV